MLNAEELGFVPPTKTACRATVALHRALHALYAAGGTSEEAEAARPEAGKGNVNANEPEENSSSRLLAVARHQTSGRKAPKKPTVATPPAAAYSASQNWRYCCHLYCVLHRNDIETRRVSSATATEVGVFRTCQ